MKYVFLTGICWLLFSCGGQDSPRMRLDAAEAVVADNPDSALSILGGIDGSSLRSSKLRARRALLYAEALDKCGINVDDDSLLRVAVKYYRNRGNDIDRAKTCYYQACFCENIGELDSAVKCLIKAASYADVTNDFYLCGLLNESFGRLHMAQFHLTEAASYYNKALICYDSCEMKRNEALCYTKLAKISALDNRDSDAFVNYQKAFDLFRVLGDTTMLLQINGNVAGLKYRKTKQTRLTKELLRKGYEMYSHGCIANTDLALWCVIHINDMDLDSARMCALRILRDENIPTGKRASTLFLLKDIEKRIGNHEMATYYAEEYIKTIDSVYASEQKQQIQRLERRYNNELLRANNEKLRQRNTYLIITCLLGFMVLFFVSGAVLRRRKKIIERQRLRLIHYSKFVGSLKDNYDGMKAKYEALARQQDQEDEVANRILASFKNRLEGLKMLIDNAYLYERKPAQFYEAFKKYVIINPNAQYAFSDIQYVVNKTCFGVIDYLKANYPDLTPFDLDLCSLLCFGFSQNGIRMIYEHKNTYSIYNKRSKLRKKLGLQPGEHIETFLKTLVEKLKDSQSYES